MRTLGNSVIEDRPVSQTWRLTRQRALWPNHLHLVTGHDLDDLRDGLLRRGLPPDLDAKLSRLAAGSLSHRFIEQHCRTIIALLMAAQEGSFKGVSRAERDRLLQVLAYVRKDDDAIPDYRPDGFMDDQEAVRAAATELNSLLQAFKAWRLRYQVPGMWMGISGENK